MEENKSETVWKRNQFVGKTALELWKGFVWSVNYSWSNYQSTYSAYNTRNSQLEGIGNKNGQATRNTYLVVNRLLRLISTTISRSERASGA